MPRSNQQPYLTSPPQRLAQVSRARITQIMNLLLLAPDIQEELLFLTCEGLSTRCRLSELQSILEFYEYGTKRWHVSKLFCILRQHSDGLYFARSGIFECIKIMQAIHYMQSLSTDVLILFILCEPVKLVHQLILNSVKVHGASKQSWYIVQDCFEGVINLAEEKTPICNFFKL